MKRRITISLDRDLEEKVKQKQADLIVNSNRSISFSEALNRILRESLMQKESFEIAAELDTRFGR